MNLAASLKTEMVAGDSYSKRNSVFNPTTTIEYTLPHHASVSLKLVDVLGREVMTLLDTRQETGIHRVMFNADNLSSGVYFYRLKAGDYIATRKLLYLR